MNIDFMMSKRVKVTGNRANPGSNAESYTHGETGVVVGSEANYLRVKLDNIKKYGRTYLYVGEELTVI